MKKFAVIGNPIDHSISPILHNWIFKKFPTRYTNEYVDEPPEAGPPEIDLSEAN